MRPSGRRAYAQSPQALGNAGGLFQIGLRHQHDEFLAAEPAGEIEAAGVRGLISASHSIGAVLGNVSAACDDGDLLDEDTVQHIIFGISVLLSFVLWR